MSILTIRHRSHYLDQVMITHANIGDAMARLSALLEAVLNSEEEQGINRVVCDNRTKTPGHD